MAKAKRLSVTLYAVKETKKGRFLGKNILGGRRFTSFKNAEFWPTVFNAKDAAENSNMFLHGNFKVIECHMTSDQEQAESGGNTRQRTTIANVQTDPNNRTPKKKAAPKKKKKTKQKKQDKFEPIKKCGTHPKYTGKRKPKRTKKYPNGCPVCWKIYEEKHKEVS
jgi:hypothetical protein